MNHNCPNAALPTVRLDLLTAKDIAAYLQEDDLAILPVGCTEMHGPLIPLGCDTFLDWSAAIVLGELWGCPVLPPIPYVYPGASGPWPGTIEISPEASIATVKTVALGAIRGGFKRLLIVSCHGPAGFLLPAVIRSIFQETGDIVALLSCYETVGAALEESFGRRGEDIFLLGAMRILGLHGHFRPESTIDRPADVPFASLEGLRELGFVVPWLFNRDYQHTGIHSDLSLEDADRAANCIRQALRRYQPFPDLFRQYQQDMKKQDGQPPWQAADRWSC